MQNANLVLIGFRGCGKTTFGKAISQILGLPFADLDEEIEYITDSPNFDFVEKHGWMEFREVEQRVAHDFTRNFSGIVATGGGTIENSKNLQNLKKTGKFLFLNPKFSDVKKYLLKDSTRPRINPSISHAEEIDQMWNQRKMIYQASGDHEVVPLLNGDPLEEAKKIIELIPKGFLPPAPARKRIAVLASGNGTTLQGVYEKKQHGRIPNAEFALFITDNPDSKAINVAKEMGFEGIEVLPPKDGQSREDYDIELLNVLREYQPDQILLMGWMRILSPTYVAQYGQKTYNVHPSLLPKFAGLKDTEVHEKVLDYEEKYTGCTIHRVTNEVDSGEIAIQRKMLVGADDTVQTLKKKVQKQEVLGFCELIERK